MRAFFCLLLAFVALSAAQRIVPSEKCDKCRSTVSEMEVKWDGPDGAAGAIAELKEKCKEKEKHHWLKRELCDKLVDEFAKIPPQIFEGMINLAWDVPLGACTTLKQCETECCDEDAQPEQVHLSLAADDRSLMGVSWVTLNKNETVVQYGLSADALDQTVSGNTNTYKNAGWIGTIHRAIMTDLKAASTYHYRVGSPSADNWSQVFSFKTFDPTQPRQTYAVLADMGYGEASDATIKRLEAMVDAGTLDVVVHSGDIGYADGYMPHWDTFMNKVQNIAARVPYMVTPGNHEFWYNFAAYKARFFMPSVDGLQGEGSNDNMYYAWSYGRTHFQAINSETALDTMDFHKKNIKFFDEDLNAVDRTATPFVVTHFHRPMYCTNEGSCSKVGKTNKLTKQAEDIFLKAQVDVCITGHVHEYERTYPMKDAALVSKDLSASTYQAPIYIVQGASGNREGNKGSFPDSPPDWSAAHSNEVGYGIMTVENTAGDDASVRPTMHWSYKRSADDVELDSFKLEK